MSREAQLRYYVDADLLGLARFLVSLRADVTYPGDPGGAGLTDVLSASLSCALAQREGPRLVPVVAERGWVILTKDGRISRLPEERRAVRENEARMIVIASRDPRAKLRKWDQLEVVFTQWRRIDALAELPGPWIYRATRTSLTKLDVDTGHPA